MRPPVRPALALAAALLIAAAGGRLAGAQVHGGHPLPPRPRPLHARVAEADLVVVAHVREVDAGRIRVDGARALVGTAPERFEVKRSPTDPPPLGPGDRAILPLRGARPPYVLVDRPLETIRLADAVQEERWSGAVRAVAEAVADPARLPPLYVDWLLQGPDTLRELGLQGLLDPSAAFQPLGDAFQADLAARAFDRSLPAEGRGSAAGLAALSPAGAARLLAGIPSRDDPAEPSISQAALRGGVHHGSAGLGAALRRCLATPDAALRLAGLEAAGLLDAPLPADLRAAVARIAEADADDAVRERARAVLAAASPDPGADTAGERVPPPG